jgi:chromatin remodeling complex protein RSC6
MVRPSKSAAAPVVTETPVVAAKAPRAKKPKADVAAAAPAPVANTLTEAVADVAAPVTDASALVTKMTEFSAKLQQYFSLGSAIKNDFKTLEKLVSREVKNAAKAASKKRRNTGNRKPSGFTKATRISDELAVFLGKSVGTEMARTEVSKEINAYIHSNGLKDKTNGRKINADEKLTKLLRLNKEDELTYFNLQRYMKHHFEKAPVATA